MRVVQIARGTCKRASPLAVVSTRAVLDQASRAMMSGDRVDGWLGCRIGRAYVDRGTVARMAWAVRARLRPDCHSAAKIRMISATGMANSAP